MQKQFSEVVSFNTAIKLKESGFHEKTYRVYNAAGQLIYDDFPYDWNGIKSASNPYAASAPTFAEVLDWLLGKGIIIQPIPAFTFALKCKICFDFKIFVVDQKEPRLVEAYHWNDWASSPFGMNEVIIKAIEILKEINAETNS